jgi:hypothetical protein
MRLLVLYLLSIVSLSVASLGSTARAEIPNKPPEKLHELASHIFTGKVLKIYSTVERTSPKSETTFSVAEIEVASVEKGEHARPLAYVRFWKRRHLGSDPPPPAHYGHRGVPKVGAQTRVYVMAEEDGGYDVLSPIGFAAIDPKE